MQLNGTAVIALAKPQSPPSNSFASLRIKKQAEVMIHIKAKISAMQV
jgi:hypothetical protein